MSKQEIMIELKKHKNADWTRMLIWQRNDILRLIFLYIVADITDI